MSGLKATLTELPKQVFGEMMFNIMFSNDKEEEHFIGTVENDGRFHVCFARAEIGEDLYYSAGSSLMLSKPNSMEPMWHAGTGITLEEFIGKCFHQYMFDLYERGMQLDYIEVNANPTIPVDLSFAFQCCVGGDVDISRATVVNVVNVPSRHRNVSARPKSKPRLSKEDWLKQNYPGMTELPKWRFPGLAG
jgi:hypothetical protein